MVRPRQLWAAIVLCLPVLSQAQGVLADRKPPKCATTCLRSTLPVAQRTNDTFICFDDNFNNQLTACVTQNCTIREQLTAKNVGAIQCQAPMRNRSPEVLINSIASGSVAFAAVILRLIGRYYTLGNGSRFRFGLDDYAIMFTVACSIALSALNYPITVNGFGRDVWTLSFDNITEFLLLFWVTEILYNFVIMGTKISVLCFYLRLFQDRKFRNVVYGTLIVTISFLISFVGVLLFQCRPLNYVWLGWDGERPGKCVDFNANVWASAGLNIVLDLFICLLPMPQLKSLTLSTKKKAMISAMLGVGLLTTIFSIVRLTTLVKVGKSQNPTYDYVDVSVWSVLEINVGIFCACMPGLWAFFKVAFPFMFSDSTTKRYPAPSMDESDNSRKKHHAKPWSELEWKDGINVSIRVEVDTTINDRSYDRSQIRSPTWK